MKYESWRVGSILDNKMNRWPSGRGDSKARSASKRFQDTMGWRSVKDRALTNPLDLDSQFIIPYTDR